MSPMPDLLRLHADASGDRAAVIVDAAGGGRPAAVTFGELNSTVNRLAHALRSLGMQPGERLVWCGPNSLEVVTTIHAARKAGQIAVPLSYRFNADEMQYVIDNSDATLVVVDAEQAPLVAEIRDRIPKVRAVIAYGGDTPAGFEAWDDVLASQPDRDPTVDEASLDRIGAQMLYTSGTTGKPKGAVRTTSDPVIVGALLGELGLVPGNEVHITTGPLYHSGPLAFAVISHTLGCPVVILRRFDPVAWLRLVKEHAVTNTFSAPTQLKRLVTLPPGELERADMSSMRCLIANAAPVPYALKQEVVAKLGDGFLYEVYGSTELGIVTVLKPADQLRKPGSCGKVYGGIEVKLVREDGTEADVGEPGELFIRTGLAMDGYHRTDEQLAELSDGGWKSVGDVAYRDDEAFLFINDRKKDMIISGGVNIYPAEIEAVLHEHPQVLDVAVFGIPDDEWGESVYAVVQAKTEETIDLAELRVFVEARVAGYKRPRRYELRDELPRTDAGKLLKRVLRDEFWRDRATAV
jgi:acyl-CoA synthetase (AMP-forming)/AMP-acid ligase II